MKTLYIVRHGKSSWEGEGLKDSERPLLTSGEQRTLLVARYLLEHSVVPDLIISSHAVRAYETASLIASSLNYPRHKIQVEPHIYNNGAEEIWSIVFSLPDDKKDVMLVGHNPTLTQFANGLLDKPVDFLPTSAVVSVSFQTDKWDELFTANKQVNFVIYPKHLENKV